MEKLEYIDNVDNRFQELMSRYLRQRSLVCGLTSEHLDQDTLAAFTEGVLTDRQALPVIAHLSDCTFCRHNTSELMRLDLAVTGVDDVRSFAGAKSQTGVAETVSNWFARIFGFADDAVFAHSDDEKEDGYKDKRGKE